MGRGSETQLQVGENLLFLCFMFNVFFYCSALRVSVMDYIILKSIEQCQFDVGTASKTEGQH